MAIDVGRAVAYLDLDARGFDTGLTRARASMARLRDDSTTTAQRMDIVGGAMQSVGGTLTKFVSLPLIALGALSAKTAIEFESAMSEVAAVSGSTAGEMAQLREQAIELGASTKFSAIEAAEGMQNFASAGYDASEIMDVLPGTLNLAASANAGLAETCYIVANAMNGLGMDVKEADDFVDMMAATAAASNANVLMMGETMNYVAPVAGTLGIQMNDLSLAIGLMSNAGIVAGSAGTALRAGLTNLVKPTNDMQEAMDKYGITVQKTNDGSVDLKAQIDQLQQKLGGLTPTQQASALASIFGKEAMSGWAAIVNSSADTTADMAHEIDFSTVSMQALEKFSKSSGVEVGKLATVFTDAKGAAEILGIKESDLVEMTGLLGAAGLTTSDSMTKFVDSIGSVRKPTEEAEKAFKAYGIEIKKNDKGHVDSNKLIEDTKKALGGLDKTTRDTALATMYGKGAVKEWNAVLGATPATMKEMDKAIETSGGKAKEIADIMLKNVKGSAEGLGGAFDTVKINIGTMFLPFIDKVIGKLTELCDAFNEQPESTQKVIVAFGIVAAIIPILLLVVGSLIMALPRLRDGWVLFNEGMTIAKSGIGRLLPSIAQIGSFFTLTNIIIIAVIAIIALLVARFIHLYKTNEEFRTKVDAIWKQIKIIFKGAMDAIMKIIDTMVKTSKKFWTKYGDDIRTVFKAIGQFMKGDWEGAAKTLKPIVEKIKTHTLKVFKDMLKGIGDFGKKILKSITKPFTDAYNEVKKIWKKITDLFSSPINAKVNVTQKTTTLIPKVQSAPAPKMLMRSMATTSTAMDIIGFDVVGAMSKASGLANTSTSAKSTKTAEKKNNITINNTYNSPKESSIRDLKVKDTVQMRRLATEFNF